jgi:hypothetical protein
MLCLVTTLKCYTLALISSTILILIFHPFLSMETSASPTFTNQEIRDLIRDEILSMFNMETSASPSFTNQEISDGIMDWIDINAQEYSKNASLFADIRRVDYFSNGRTLNATVWLSAPFNDDPSKVGIESVSYGMFIDADFNDDSGWFYGVDHQLEIAWQNKSWTRNLATISSLGDIRILDTDSNYTAFFDMSQNYISLSVDLTSIVSSDKFKLIFYTIEKQRDESTQKMDLSKWITVPPLTMVLSLTPNPVQIRPGEEQIITAYVNSTSPFDSNVHLFSVNDRGIKSEFIPAKLGIPPLGKEKTNLNIDALKNAEIGEHELNVIANTTLPLSTDSNIPLLRVFPNKIEAPSIQSSLAVNVLPPLTAAEQLSKFLNVYSNYASFIPLVITAIVTGAISKGIDIKNSAILTNLSVTDILQIDATVIAGVLIFLTIGGTEIGRLSAFAYMTASIVYPFAISAIRVIVKGTAESGIKFMIAGFVYLMAAVILISFI